MARSEAFDAIVIERNVAVQDPQCLSLDQDPKTSVPGDQHVFDRPRFDDLAGGDAVLFEAGDRATLDSNVKYVPDNSVRRGAAAAQRESVEVERNE
jgi:hypothetical protein